MINLQNIILCNAGQATGLEKSAITKLVRDLQIDEHPKFIAEKGETHSFLVFSTTESAALFYDTYNGKAKIDENGTPLYMSFVESGKLNIYLALRYVQVVKGLLRLYTSLLLKPMVYLFFY